MKIALIFGLLVCWFEMVAVTDAYFKLVHTDSEKVAEAYYGTYDGTSGRFVRIWDRDDANRGEEQTWYITYDASYGCTYGYFLRNKKYPDMVLGIAFMDLNIINVPRGVPGFKYEQPYSCSRRWSISGSTVTNMGEWPPNSGVHFVLALKNGVTTNGNDVITESSDGGTDQQWSMETVYFLIKNPPSGKVVQVCSVGACSGTGVELHTLVQGAERQLWYWDGKYIRNKWQSTKVLDFVSISYEEHEWGMVFMNTKNNPETDNQKWNMVPGGLTSDYNGLGLRLDLYEWGTEDGTAVGCYEATGAPTNTLNWFPSRV